MRIQSIFNKTYITLLDEYGRVPNIQLQIYATSGGQKGCCGEQIAQTWQDVTKGIVIAIVDPKKEVEYSYFAYEPKETYHLNRLKSDGMIPSKRQVKLWHPMTLNIPKGYLPDINFYSIPIKKLSKEEFGILAETDFESESVKIMMRARDNLTKEDGLFAFLHEIQRMVKGRKEKKHSIPDPKNFYLSVGAGTSKSIVEASSYLSPFKNDCFLRKESCPYSIDWKNILSDNSCVHVFFTKWVAPLDDKVHGFIALSLLNQILNNIDYATKPILILIPEILSLCPEDSLGYHIFLSQAFEKAMITMRSKGHGVSSISDSQNWMKTDSKIKGSATVTLFGKLNPEDLDRVVKARAYNREKRELIMNLRYNEFIMANFEDYGSFRFFLPKTQHCEESYNWIDSYKENFPEKMKRYNELMDYMQSELKEEENKIKRDIEKKKRLEELERKREEKELEEKSTKSKKLDSEIQKTKSKKNELEEAKRKLIIDWINNPNIDKKEKTERKISEKFKLGRYVVHKILLEIENPKSNELSQEDIRPMIGDGVMKEDIEDNFNDPWDVPEID